MHYREHFSDIKEKKPWVKELKNDAQRERRRQKREFENTLSLDQLMEKYEEHNNKRPTRGVDF